MDSKHSPRPNWQPAAWAGPQQSQTHRGPHRRGVAAGRGRAAYCDQGHGTRPGAPGPAGGTAPSRSPTDSPCPAGPGRRVRSHQGLAPPRGRTLKGQTPVQPDLRSPQAVATAPPFVSPQVRSASSPPPETRWGRGAGAEPGNGGGKGQPTWVQGSVPPHRRRPCPCPPCSAQLGHLSCALGLNRSASSRDGT